MSFPNVLDEIEEIKSTYISKDGGALYSNVKLDFTSIDGYTRMNKTDENGFFIENYTPENVIGSRLCLRSSIHETRGGWFELDANNGIDTKKVLVGKPDGSLLWDGSNVVTDNRIVDLVYPVNSLYETTSSTNPSSLFGGTWSLYQKFVNTNGWKDFTWKNSSYYGTTQSSYTINKWCVVDNIFYTIFGVGAVATINTADETEIYRIPITGMLKNDSNARAWNGAVGGSGAVSGFILRQNTSYVSLHMKPHTTANNHAAPWYSSFFVVPLNNGVITDSSLFTTKYVWRRTA